MPEISRVAGPTHEEVIIGDFVRLASGSPLGLVSDVRGGVAAVTWFTVGFPQSSLPWLCLRPLGPSHAQA